MIYKHCDQHYTACSGTQRLLLRTVRRAPPCKLTSALLPVAHHLAACSLLLELGFVEEHRGLDAAALAAAPHVGPGADRGGGGVVKPGNGSGRQQAGLSPSAGARGLQVRTEHVAKRPNSNCRRCTALQL